MNDNYMNTREIAKYLGICYAKTLDFIKYSGIKYIRIGRMYYVSKNIMLEFLENNIEIKATIKVDNLM